MFSNVKAQNIINKYDVNKIESSTTSSATHRSFVSFADSEKICKDTEIKVNIGSDKNSIQA